MDRSAKEGLELVGRGIELGLSCLYFAVFAYAFGGVAVVLWVSFALTRHGWLGWLEVGGIVVLVARGVWVSIAERSR